MTIVCIHAKPTEKSRKEGKSLLPLRLKPLDMCAGSVDRLCLLVGLACSIEVGEERSCRIDRIGELLVKPTCLQNSQRLKVMLNEDVVVICLRWHEVGVTRRNGRIRSLVWIDNGCRDEIAYVGTSETTPINHP